MMINSKIDTTDSLLEMAAFRVSIESEYTFSIQNEIIKRTECNFRAAQEATEKILCSLMSELSDFKESNPKALKAHIHKLITLEVKSLKASMSKNFGLSESEFNVLVKKLQAGDHTLFKETFLAHFEDCLKYLIRRHRASYDNAYDITMDTLLEFRLRLVNNKITYGNIRFLFTQMASQLYMKKAKSPESIGLETIDLPMEENYIDEESLMILEKSWQQLGEGCQDLLKKVYYGKMKLKDIAVEELKSSVAIRKQKERCVSKLKNYFLKFSKSYL